MEFFESLNGSFFADLFWGQLDGKTEETKKMTMARTVHQTIASVFTSLSPAEMYKNINHTDTLSNYIVKVKPCP
jgi:hypothetical protein